MPDVITDEFDDIVAQLIEERPQIDPAFARELDAQAAAGFPRRRRLALPSIKWSFPMWVPAGGLAAVIAVVIAIGATSGPSTDSDLGGASVATVERTEEDSGGGSSAAAEPEIQAYDEPLTKDSSASEAQRSSGGAAADSAGPLTSVAPPSDPPLGRQRVQEHSASVTLEVPAKDIDPTNQAVIAMTTKLGGFVVSSSVRSTDEDTGGGNYVLRIPVDRLDEALQELSRMGHVRESSQGVQDITAERNVARENLQEAKAIRISLLRRIAEADTDAEVAALRAQLRSLNAQIGSYRGQLRNVVRRASFASVALTLAAETKDNGSAGEEDNEWTPGDAWNDAGRVLEVVAGIALIALAILIPLGMLIAAAVLTHRVLARRGRERALDAI